MDSLQQKFEQVFNSIKLDDAGKTLLASDLIYSCLVNEDFTKITLILPESSSLRKTLPGQIESGLKALDEINRVAVEILSEPPAEEQGPPSQTSRPVQQPKRTAYLQNYDAVIAVASGKGGVGKSTVSVNLAIALSKMGYKVSLFDADIYGPSLPIMTGLRGERPLIENNRLIPIEAYGLHTMSIGNLVEEDASMIWRGPMVHQAIEQLLRDTEWPGGDFMILDLPPGTGDAQLTISQLCEVSGAVIVSTPQDVALLDAVKAVHMFTKVDISILGIVENMSMFVCPHCQKETPIFSTHGAEATSKKMNVPFLGGIPIDLAIRQGGDEGKPVMATDVSHVATESFKNIALNVIKSLEAL
ncbi:MAG: Mrp/NBP35 family ATP-binding protein [SAR324 cluster bacterium]|nr:Mrp/NBP35 family ATP-binding protein [SAR324 cluster bacterium]